MAQFKGTFQIFAAPAQRKKIDSRVRDLVKYAFAHACLTMMYEYAVRVPVLSGMTRQAVISAMESAIQQFRAKGIDIDISSYVSMETTRRKLSVEDIPTSQSILRYNSPVWWLGPSGTDHLLSGRVGTESSWKSAVESEGQNAAKGIKYQTAEVFKFFGSPSRGAYSFYWNISVPHWAEYDWDLMKYVLRYFDEDLRSLIPPIAKHLAVEISESLLARVKTRGKMYGGVKQLIAKAPTAFNKDTGIVID